VSGRLLVHGRVFEKRLTQSREPVSLQIPTRTKLARVVEVAGDRVLGREGGRPEPGKLDFPELVDLLAALSRRA